MLTTGWSNLSSCAREFVGRLWPAHKAGKLSDGNRIHGDLKCAERYPVLWQLTILVSVLVLVGIAAHEEGTSGHIAERWKNDLCAALDGEAIPQFSQPWRETVRWGVVDGWNGLDRRRRLIRRQSHGGDQAGTMVSYPVVASYRWSGAHNGGMSASLQD
jgi:hypothetical protein